MILSVHSSAEEMVASVTVNDPSKCFPILRKTIQLIQSLEKTNRKQKGDLSKKKKKKKERKEQNRHNTKKQNFKRKEERKIFLHKKLKDLLPPNIWTMWI